MLHVRLNLPLVSVVMLLSLPDEFLLPLIGVEAKTLQQQLTISSDNSYRLCNYVITNGSLNAKKCLFKELNVSSKECWK